MVASLGFFGLLSAGPGGLAKSIGVRVGRTVTGPGASDGLPLSDRAGRLSESSSGISSTVLSLGIPS